MLTTNGQLDQVLTDRLARIERRFTAELHSDLDCVNDLTAHVERYRGKMLRPMLTVLASMALQDPARSEPSDDASAERVDLLATVFEMVHMSTLVHDDVLDEADIRRRGETINRLQGNEAAVMLGDYLISHAYHLCCGVGHVALAKAVAAATNTVCEGELLQLSHRGDFTITPRTYFEIVKRKTAALTAACCALPVMLLEEPPSNPRSADALLAYGEKLGIAFQIIDDVLDLTGDEAVVGKSLGRDLLKGKLTLPVILWLESLGTPADGRDSAWDAASRRLEAAAFGQGLNEIRAEVAGSDAVAAAHTRAADLIADAKTALTTALPPSDARARLEALADAVLTRSR